MRIILEKRGRLDIFKPTCSHSYEHVFIFSCDYIAIGNGVGCRETEILLVNSSKKEHLHLVTLLTGKYHE